MKKILSISFLFVFLFSFAQADENIPLENKTINTQLLEELILLKINKVRDSLHLKPFDLDNNLKSAALLQSNYMAETNIIGHIQKNEKYATLSQRVFESNCTNNGFAENVAYWSARKSKTPITYNHIADIFVQGWIKSKGHFDNLSNPEMVFSGISVTFSAETQSIFATHVMGGPIYNAHNIQVPSKIYHFAHFNKAVCGECIKKWDTAQANLAFNLILEGNKILFVSDNKELLKKVFNSNKFYISGDILFRDQFPCDGPNQLHGSPYFDGLPIPPMSLNKIIKNNVSTVPNEVVTPIYELPFESNQTTEINTFLLKKQSKKQHQCLIFSISPQYGSKLDILPPTFILEKYQAPTEVVSQKKILKFTVPFEKSKYTFSQPDIQPIIDSIKLHKFVIQKINLTAYASVEGDSSLNHSLQENRAKSILKLIQGFQLQNIQTTIKTSENWASFKRDAASSKYADTLAKMNKHQIKKFLENDSIAAYFEPQFIKHRKALLQITIEERTQIHDSLHTLIARYEKAIADTTMEESKRLSYQKIVLSHIADTNFNAKKFFNIDIPYKKSNISLLHARNLLYFNETHNIYKPENINQLLEWAIKKPEIQHDIYSMLVFDSYQNLDTSFHYEIYEKGISNLKHAKEVKPGDYNKLYVNYNILLAEYYKQKNNIKKEREAASKVFSHFKHSALTETDALILANFLVHYEKADLARNLLRPYTLFETCSQDLLFYYLDLVIFDNTDKGNLEFKAKMEHAKEMNHERFCKLFGYPAFSFQLLRDPTLKHYFCDSCNENISGDAKAIQKLESLPTTIEVK